MFTIALHECELHKIDQYVMLIIVPLLCVSVIRNL